MADYYPLLAKAVAGLPDATAEARHAVYERARKALFGQLRNLDPPVPEEVIEREAQALERAVAQLETELRRVQSGKRAPSGGLAWGRRQSNGAAARAKKAVAVRLAPPERICRDRRQNGRQRLHCRLASLKIRRDPAGRPRPLGPSGRHGRDRPLTQRGRRHVQVQAIRRCHFLRRSRFVAGRNATSGARPASGPRGNVRGKDAPFFEPFAPEAIAPGQGVTNQRQERGLKLYVRLRRMRKETAVRPSALGLWLQSSACSLSLSPRPPLSCVTAPRILCACSRLRTSPGRGWRWRQNRGSHYTAHRDPRLASSFGDRGTQRGSESWRGPANPAIPVARRAALVMEAPDQPSGIKTIVGTVVWRVNNVSNGPDEPLSTSVRAEIDIPDADLQATMAIQKNFDSTLPASHIIKLNFTMRPDSPLANVKQVSVLIRREENQTGEALKGITVPVTENSFLIGLSRGDGEASNLDLLRSPNGSISRWFSPTAISRN